MMKRKLLVGVIVAVLLMSVTVTSAQGPPGSGWWTAQQIQATGGDDTTVTLEAYSQTPGSAAVSCGDTTLDQGEAFVWVPTDAWGITPNCASLAENEQYSAVVSANNEIVAIVEETNQSAAPLGTSGGLADATYRGLSGSDAASELRFPTYKNNHYNETTTFYIQNAGSADTTFVATFQECNSATTVGCSGTGATYYFTLTTALEPNRMAVIQPADALAASGNGFFGGLTVTSLNGQPLAGIVNEHAVTGAPATYLKSTRAFVPAEYDQKLYAPAIKHTYVGKWSGLVIQNAGTVAGNFTIVYNIANSDDPLRVGNVYTDTTTCVGIQPGETCFVLTLYPVSGSGTASLQAGEYVAATVTGNVPMVAVVNEETLPGAAGQPQLATYSAVPDGGTAMNVSVPSYKEEWVGRYMGVVVMNVGTAAATIDATVIASAVEVGSLPTANLVVRASNIAPGAATTFFLLSKDQAQSIYPEISTVSGTIGEFVNSNCAMSVASDQPVAILVNQENSYLAGPAVPLDAANYEGFPLP
jgi:hypothetical protein